MFNNYNDGTFKKVTKNTALKAFNAGLDIYMLPCKANPKSYWINPAKFNKKMVFDAGRTIESVINEYTFYNCNNQLGNYITYYVNA